MKQELLKEREELIQKQKSELMKPENLNAIEDETMKRIFVTIINDPNYDHSSGKNYEKIRDKFLDEFGMSKKDLTRTFRKALKLVRNQIYINNEMKFQEYVKACYDENEILSLERIAKQHNIDVEELKNIFTDYVSSFSLDDNLMAVEFPFSNEALKKGNIQILENRVDGFAEHIISQRNIGYSDGINHLKEQEIQFLRSVKYICKKYYENNKSEDKVMKLTK